MLKTINHNDLHSDYFVFQGKRKYQEDWFYSNDKNGIYIVCDGIGGGIGGDIASRGIVLALEGKTESLKKVKSNTELESIILDAYQDWIASTGDFHGNDSMGTTLVLLLIIYDQAYIAHIGDSRAYYFKQGKLEWVSKDHSVVQELYDAGVIKDKLEMQNHPMKNRITNALMINPDSAPPKVDISTFDGIREGDIFILCSDGAIEKYSDQDMVNLFTNSSLAIQDKWEKFKNKAMHSSDNSTAILVLI